MPPLTGDPKEHDPSEFSSSMSGSCLCGSVSVTINDNELFSTPRGHLCHCANCRKVAGSFVSSNLLIDADKVEIKDRDGTLKVYDDKATGSGNSVYRYFCSRDGKYVQVNYIPPPRCPTTSALHTERNSYADQVVLRTSPIKSEAHRLPGKVIVKMGIMPRIPMPEMESFGLHKHDWQGKHPNVKTFRTAFYGPGAEMLDEV